MLEAEAMYYAMPCYATQATSRLCVRFHSSYWNTCRVTLNKNFAKWKTEKTVAVTNVLWVGFIDHKVS